MSVLPTRKSTSRTGIELCGFCNSAYGTAPGILYILSIYLRNENMHPHNYRLVYFNAIATENIHTTSKTPKGLIICPARNHWENNHIDPSDFLIAGPLLWVGFAYLSPGPYVGIGSEIWRTLWTSQLSCVPKDGFLNMSDSRRTGGHHWPLRTLSL